MKRKERARKEKELEKDRKEKERKEKERREKERRRKNVTIEESGRKERATSTKGEDIRIMMITEGMRGAIATGIAIAIVRRTMVPVIATVT